MKAKSWTRLKTIESRLATEVKEFEKPLFEKAIDKMSPEEHDILLRVHVHRISPAAMSPAEKTVIDNFLANLQEGLDSLTSEQVRKAAALELIALWEK